MKTLIIYYSYTGHTKQIVRNLESKESTDVVEIKDVRRPGILKAYSMGCFAAMRGKAWRIQSMKADMKAYDRLILFSPVWAGNPPPAVHAFLKRLPKGKSISVKMISASGRSGCQTKIEEAIKAKGSIMDGFEDIKA